MTSEAFWHRSLSGARLHDSYNFVQSDDPETTDPDILVAGMNWLDTTSAPYIPKRRNDTNDDWILLGASVTGYVKADGSVAFTGDQSMGSHKITNLAAPGSGGDAVNKTYADGLVTGLLDFKGSTDCSGNPNYPSASKGDAYIVSVSGKIGGASGLSVDVGDVYFAIADNAGGTQ